MNIIKKCVTISLIGLLAACNSTPVITGLAPDETPIQTPYNEKLSAPTNLLLASTTLTPHELAYFMKYKRLSKKDGYGVIDAVQDVGTLSLVKDMFGATSGMSLFMLRSLSDDDDEKIDTTGDLYGNALFIKSPGKDWAKRLESVMYEMLERKYPRESLSTVYEEYTGQGVVMRVDAKQMINGRQDQLDYVVALKFNDIIHNNVHYKVVNAFYGKELQLENDGVYKEFSKKYPELIFFRSFAFDKNKECMRQGYLIENGERVDIPELDCEIIISIYDRI